MTPPTVIRRGLPRARDPERDHTLRATPEFRDHVGASPRRPVLSAEHDTALLPNVAAPGEPVAFPPVTETDWRTLVIRDAEDTAAPEVRTYLRSPEAVRKWRLLVKGIQHEIDFNLGEKSRYLKAVDEDKRRGDVLDEAERLLYTAANEWKLRALRLLAKLRTRGEETNQAIRQLDEATHYGAVAIRKAEATVRDLEHLLAWAASEIPHDGTGAAWHAAAAKHWRGTLPVGGEVAETEGPG